MSELSQKNILVIDCQTTGMHPKNGFLLQIGWGILNPCREEQFKIEKWTLKLPDNEEIPLKIRKMLQLTDEELNKSVEPRDVFDNLQKALTKLGPKPVVLAHYAQFELSFLKKFYQDHLGSEALNFELICTQKIAKRLFPTLPSHNLKAMAGFFQMANTTKNEINSHVMMTATVWKKLISVLISKNISSYRSLFTWLKINNKTIKAYRFEYNIERLMRLDITDKPGVYKMLARDGSILYIGKATSLKSRVNSYFRGVKNRDRRKLEMLAQVWDFDLIECETPLEAALLESDEIKKWNPPYNILLKSDSRKLLFYNYEYTQFSENQDTTFFNGPFRPYDEFMVLIEFLEALKTQSLVTYLNENITPEIWSKAWGLFCSTYEIEFLDTEHLSLRGILLIASKMLIKFEKIHGKGGFQKWWLNEKKKNLEEEWSIEQKFSNKIARIFIRAAEAKRKSRQMKLLFDCSLVIKSTQKRLTLINGEFEQQTKLASEKNKAPFDLHHYDRLSILLSAKNRKEIILE